LVRFRNPRARFDFWVIIDGDQSLQSLPLFVGENVISGVEGAAAV